MTVDADGAGRRAHRPQPTRRALATPRGPRLPQSRLESHRPQRPASSERSVHGAATNQPARRSHEPPPLGPRGPRTSRPRAHVRHGSRQSAVGSRHRTRRADTSRRDAAWAGWRRRATTTRRWARPPSVGPPWRLEPHRASRAREAAGARRDCKSSRGARDWKSPSGRRFRRRSRPEPL